MEYLKLILEFVKALAWPSTVIVIFIMLRPSIRRLFESIIDARNFELEIGGQKLKVDRLGESVKKTIKEGIELSKNESPEKLDSYIKENSELLAEISTMEPDELSVLEFIEDHPGIHTKGNMDALGWYGSFEHGYAMVRRVLFDLLEKNLVERSMVKGVYRYQITNKGSNLLELYKNNSSDA